MAASDPHASQPLFTAGAPLGRAPAAMILLHGRGASAQDILGLAAELGRPDLAYLAPQASDYTWYPNRFFMPAASNEPWLSSALARVGVVVAQAQSGLPAGADPRRVFLLGFSQGACLAAEYVARHPAAYGGLFVLSGALIENGDQPRAYAGDLGGTPVFLGSSPADPHIPRERVERSAEVLRGLNAAVTTRFYPGLGHGVNQAELDIVREMLAQRVLGAA